MGKHLEHKPSGISIKNNHPGCMWSILHILHYHRWHYVKKILPYRRHGSGKHAVGDGNPGSDIEPANTGKMQEQIDAEMDSSLIEEKATEPITRSSVKSRIKALIYEEKSKRRGRHRRISSCPVQTQLQQTNSIHHLEASNMDPPAEIAFNDESPKIVHENNETSSVAYTLDQLQSKLCETSVTSNEKCDLCATMLTMNYLRQSQVHKHGNQSAEDHTLLQDKLNEVEQDLLEKKLIYVKGPTKDFSLHESKQCLDAVDIFNMNKELLLKILQDPSSPLAHEFPDQQSSNSRGLTKSMSFPFPGSSGGRHVGRSKLKHKQEIESWAEVEAEQKMDGIPKPYLARPVSFDNSSLGSAHGLKNQHENKMVIKHFKTLKQKIKHAIRESRKEKHRITMDAVLHKIPYGQRLSKDVKEEMADLWKDRFMDKCSKYSPRSSSENDQSVPALGKGKRMRRSSSCNESLDRYFQLFESSFNRESKNCDSGRLKLRTEDTPSPGWSDPKSLGRILSLPDLRSDSYLKNEVSPDAATSGMPSNRTAINSIVREGCTSLFDEQKILGLSVYSENEILLDAPEDRRSQETSEEVGELFPALKDEVGSALLANDGAESKLGQTLDNLGNLTSGEISTHNEHEISVPDSNFQEEMTSPAMFPISDDSGKPRCLLFHGVESLDSLANQQLETGMDSPSAAKSSFNLEKIKTPIMQFNGGFPLVRVDAKDIPEFNFVRDVLELSGFSRNEYLGTWHSADQPLDPSMFDEVEGSLLPELNCSGNEEGGNCNHLLLFDLINETLLEVHERSFTYWPVPLSSCSLIRPVPAGYHVLEEVWANISWYLSWRPELEQSMDDAVSRDLAKGDGWMNLQFDAECVGLELEDMILDDLLEELIWT